MKGSHDITNARLSDEQYQDHFTDIAPPLTDRQAQIESERCLFCYDAPCITACPSDIDIPGFIRKISVKNLDGAAQDILSENILGGSCARICPTEELCEEACVRNKQAECKPVDIGSLQRYALDNRPSQKAQPFERQAETGKRIAVIGAGPAGLACAHRLAVFGHNIDLIDAKEKAGGLNEYGIAAYKLTEDFAQKEVDFILDIGGITLKPNTRLGSDITLDQLSQDYDAVFVGIGLQNTNDLGIDGEDLPGVIDAVDYIAELRQTSHLKELAVGNDVIVIGAGNTAVDIAVQTRKLGAENVTMVYRRGEKQMSATWHEQEIAQTNDVRIRTWAKPVSLEGDKDGVSSITFERTKLENDRLVGTGENFTLKADVVFKAIGQKFDNGPLAGNTALPELVAGKIKVDEHCKTTLNNVWAGGDCINDGEDLAVVAVKHGKLAAASIHQFLTEDA